MMKGSHAVAASLLVAAVGVGCASRLPEYRAPESVAVLDQNWRPEQRAWFYHASQGTKLMPYRWFLALEQPRLRPFGSAPRFAAPEHLARFGFIPDAPSAENPDGLPVGFSRDEFGVREGTDQPETVVGLTCAACHTGQIEVRPPGGAHRRRAGDDGHRRLPGASRPRAPPDLRVGAALRALRGPRARDAGRSRHAGSAGAAQAARRLRPRRRHDGAGPGAAARALPPGGRLRAARRAGPRRRTSFSARGGSCTRTWRRRTGR